MAKPAKATESARETFVEIAQDTNFADHEPEPQPRGRTLESDMDVIRAARAKERAARGHEKKRRVLTNYHDAERLHNLATGKIEGKHRDSFGRVIRNSSCTFPGIATAQELVEAEENGLLPNPEHYATGTTAAGREEVDAEDAPTEDEG